jgi:hypothetical protein
VTFNRGGLGDIPRIYGFPIQILLMPGRLAEKHPLTAADKIKYNSRFYNLINFRLWSSSCAPTRRASKMLSTDASSMVGHAAVWRDSLSLVRRAHESFRIVQNPGLLAILWISIFPCPAIITIHFINIILPLITPYAFPLAKRTLPFF